jgi:chromate transporter
MNVVNLAIWIGWRLRRGPGVAAALAGLIGPAFLMLIALWEVFQRAAELPAAHRVVAGIGAAAIGLSLEMALRATRRAAIDLLSGLMAAAVFVAVFLLRLPVVAVVAVAAPIGIAIAYLRSEVERP